ncbi:hypothetical protein [Tsukamurella sp. NPDC003166]|uniref:hypothetical protein n=1 Tax=Tsukamurella sp. NPDC003166 TaxID=3154444 RepID=UPI0033B920BA
MSTEGLARRDDGWSAVQAADAAVNREYRPHYEQALIELIALGKPFTADDVEQRAENDAEGCPCLATGPHSPNLIGSVLGRAAKCGRIRRTGARRRSTHPARNAAYNPVWRPA